MLKGYSEIKRQAIDSEISTRSILSAGIQKLHPCSIAKLPEFQSIKQTIRNHKSADEETFGNTTSAAEIQIPPKYKVTLKDQPFLMFDSGMGDEARIIVFSTHKM
eukprot:TRINITY_DN3097_c0_g1_i1.p1 TRINITY_DN3097_c0_g1~~TRINITY_DN3097_c0_g1_i1.p1  ORF type:complete len:105 (-),score=6.15 TRINITY_DN3097_c0_g1_i1:102-416(-)